MLCERIMGNLADGHRADGSRAADWAGRAVDVLELEWHECGRVLKKATRAGRLVRVLLPPGQRLRHGDVLGEEGETLVAVEVRPCAVVVARPAGPRQAATLALELGNLHWPAEITDEAVIFVEDGPALAATRRAGVPWSIETRRFAPLWSAAVKVRLASGFKLTRPG